jgi:hypothetical protein
MRSVPDRTFGHVTRRALAALAVFAVLGGAAFIWHGGSLHSFRSWSISEPFGGSTITLTASGRFAGAISSLTWNGMEFINSTDHGRELQSAAQFNGLRECYNPTEAGSNADRHRFGSSSELLSISAQGNTLQSRVRMAFWVPPGKSSRTCPQPVNTTALSDHELSKTVTMSGNIIAHDVTFHVPRDYDRANFEALTAYLPKHFDTFWTYDPRSDELRPLSDGPGGQPLPVIISTKDQRFALGVYSHDLPQSSDPRRGYGRQRFTNERVSKWNCVFRRTNVAAGDHSFRCYTLVGSLDDVRAAMKKLAASRPM